MWFLAGLAVGAGTVIMVDTAWSRWVNRQNERSYREGYNLGWEHGRWHDTEEYRKPLVWLQRSNLN